MEAPLQHPRPRRTRVTITGRQWRINDRLTHPGAAAEGLLSNVRMVNCIFEDTGPAAGNLPADFDAQVNTQRFIARIPDYLHFGVVAFTIGLQGGLPGYEGSVNSAFESDGRLRAPYMNRAAQVIEACDLHGAAVILSCFYQRQHSHDRALAGRKAIRAAVSNVAGWIARQRYTNVLLEISNEYRHNGFARWPDGDWLTSDEGQVELIELARATAPTLLVSTSGMGNGTMSETIAHHADFLLIHFNNTALQDIPARVHDLDPYAKPIVCNEDNKLGAAGAEAARLAVTSGAAWGFMHTAKNQHVPFEFDGPADDFEIYTMLRQLTTAGATTAARSVAASIVIIEPKDGDTFPAGSPVTIRAAVTAGRDATAAGVEFLANGRRAGTARSAPWQVTWSPPAAGRYDLVAVQVDAQGREVTRSNAVDLVVR